MERSVYVELSAERAGTLRFTVVAAGVVLGLSGAAALPLLLPWQGQGVLTLLVALLALLPSFGLWLVRYRRNQAALERQTVCLADEVHDLATSSAAAWGEARPNSLRPRGAARAAPSRKGLERRAVPLWTSAVAVAALSGLSLAPLFNLYRGQVRVLNHGDEPFALFVDGRRVARVEPSSGESALAGASLTLPAGHHELRVVGESSGRELFRALERVDGGSPHLFAPASAGYCFTIEQRGYGEARDGVPRSVPLGGDNPFWVLPEGIAWFAGSPEPGPIETSGGMLSSLRQRRCPD